MAKKKPLSKAAAEKVRRAVADAEPQDRSQLFPPNMDEIRGITSLEFSPGESETYADLLETICGTTDDSQPVEQYDGTLGVPIAFVNTHQAPVGQLQWNSNLASIYDEPGNVSGVRWCTGTLISNDLFLTAGHCFDQTGGSWVRPKDNATGTTIPPTEIATRMQVNFNYQVDPSGNLRTEQSFAVLELVEYRLGGLDFAICRLDGNPGATWGTTAVSTTDAAVNDMICIIGHPAGWPKRIEAGPTTSLSGDSIFYNDIDTLGGNSGSGILRASDGSIVGVHTNGGCNSAGTGSNRGVRITSMIAQSPTLQGLTAPTLKVTDDGGKLKFLDDGGKSKLLDDGRTFKFSDDATLKFTDDGGTLKFSDDGGTVKFSDDGGTLKFSDDGGTLKFRDDGGTLKQVDDVKLPARDKQLGDIKRPGSDSFRPPFGGQRVSPLGREGAHRGPRPFVLSTPHHSMAWSGQGAGAAPGDEELIASYEAAISELGSMIEATLHQAAELDAEYQELVQEYEALVEGISGGRGR